MATGWDNLSDVDPGTDVQVYPVLDKTTNRTYRASNLAGLILFEAEPNTVAANYMLILSRNAVGKDALELNVVFEDGTAATIKIDDEGDDFNRNDDECYMMAYTYSENADGTYDIGTQANKYGTADLLQVGTIALNEYDYLALPGSASVWDVTEVERGGDDVPTGRFQENVYVNAVVIVSEGQVRTAWIWDLEDDQTPAGAFNFNWDTTGFETIYWFNNTYSQWQLQQYLTDGVSVRVIGDAELDNDLVIPTGTTVQFENELNDRGNDITGGGALRVRDNFYVNSGSISVNTQVGDTAGDDLRLSNSATISSRVGVYGDIIGNVNNYGQGNAMNRVNDLTVAGTGSVYVTGDVEVDELHVDGHLQANNVEIHRGVVHSSRTLVALGDITLYNYGSPAVAGTLEIGGTCGTTATTGRVELYGDLTGNGNLTVTSGVLSLARSANITLDNGATVGGQVFVDSNGTITQLAGTRHTMTMEDLDVNGAMNVPSCIIDCADIDVGSTGSLTAAGATSVPTVAAGGKTNIGDATTGEPTVSGLLKSLSIKGQEVVFNGTKGSVTLSYAQWNGNANIVSAITHNGDSYELYDAKGEQVTNPAGTNTALDADYATLKLNVKKGADVEQYTITVNMTAGSTAAVLTSLTVKGFEVDLSNPVSGTGTSTTDRIVYNVTVDAAHNSSNNEMIAAEAGDATVAITTTQGGAWNSNTGALNGTEEWYIQVTSQDGEHHTYYDVKVVNPATAWTATIGQVNILEDNSPSTYATVTNLKSGDTFDNTVPLTIEVRANAGYHVTGVNYSIGDGGLTAIQADDSGAYTIAADKLSSVNASSRLHIQVTIAKDPVVKFDGAMVKVEGSTEWVNSVSVPYGKDISFELQTNASLNIIEGDRDEYGTLQGEGLYWTITEVIGDITVTIK